MRPLNTRPEGSGELPAFERLRKDYLDDDACSRLQEALMGDPEGDPRRAKGKRGGLRVIYYYWSGGPKFWLFTLYGKG